MTAIYGKLDKETSPVWDQSSRENLPSSIWPKLAMKNGKNSVPKIVTDKERFAMMQSEAYKPQTEAYQDKLSTTGKTAAVKNWRSGSFPGWLPGQYNGKGSEFLQSYCPKIVGDIDGLCDENEVAFLLVDIKKNPLIYAAYPSPSCKGVRFEVFATSTPATHQQYETAVLNAISEALNLPIKKAGAAVSGAHIDTDNNGAKPQPWVMGHVPEELFFVNWKSEVFHDPTIKATPTRKEENRKEVSSKKSTITENYDQATNRVICEYLIGEIERDGKDITQGMSFNGEWFALASAFITEFGEQEGGAFFHRVSQFYRTEKYIYTEKETEDTVKGAAKKGTRGNIAYFYKICKEYGYQFKDFLADYWQQQREEENRKEEQKASFKNGSQSVATEGNKLPPNGGSLATAKGATEATEEQPVEEEEEFFQFYKVDKGEPKIKHLKLVQLLLKLGFVRYDLNGDFLIVHRKNNVVRECTKHEVIDAFDKYLDKQPDPLPGEVKVKKEELRNKIYAGIGAFFSNDLLGRLRPEKPIIFNEHTKSEAFFYYQNGFVRVTKEGVELKPYSELKHCIWENQILERDFVPLDVSRCRDFSFYQFLKNIANCWEVHPKTKRVNQANDPMRFESFKTILGYLLHSFFQCKVKTVVFTDSRISEDDEANGRSGKTLLLKALGQVLNRDFKRSKTYVELNGKDFDHSKTFKYQELGLDTKLVHLNDVKRGFKLEDLFNDITEGIKRERKNEAPQIIQAKMAVSTNRTIEVRAGSAKDRAIEAELGDYYDYHWSPEDEFGEWFFRDWTPDQWSMFDAILMDCVRIYFKKGVLNPITINLQERKKYEETAPEFVQWMEDREFMHKGIDRFPKSDLFTDFITRYPDFDRWITQRIFTKWMRVFCEYDPRYELDEARSNGTDYYSFKITGEEG
jgi:hypothetical protein